MGHIVEAFGGTPHHRSSVFTLVYVTNHHTDKCDESLMMMIFDFYHLTKIQISNANTNADHRCLCHKSYRIYGFKCHDDDDDT